MAMNAEHRSKFAAFHRQWRCLHMSKTFSSVTKTPNKQRNMNKTGLDPVVQNNTLVICWTAWRKQYRVKRNLMDLWKQLQYVNMVQR